ncbi:MAG: class I SAM-dependent methyltransferase [Candidatus Bathyarchaeota archaeon]|nr:class I SAM-dependent methyltransferase [Candidatus Bathyarchaeota archaeon]
MREWKEKRGTMRHYDQQAAIYDVQYLREQDVKIEDILNSMKLGSNELVLDLGCGTGFLFQHINKRVELLVGIDVSSRALREAKKRTTNMSNIVLVRADADHTPFPDHIFDKVFAITVLQNMPDPMKTITEMKRVGKPQAIFAVTGLKKKFTSESFVDLLERARLKVVTLTTNTRLKGHVAVCTNL